MEASWCHKYQVSPISWLCHLESSPLCKMLYHDIVARCERNEDREMLLNSTEVIDGSIAKLYTSQELGLTHRTVPSGKGIWEM